MLVEGNYLLLDQAPWDRLARFFDRTLFLAVPMPELRRRLLDRWDGYGREPVAAAAWVEANDMPNAAAVAERSQGGGRGGGERLREASAGGLLGAAVGGCLD